MNIRNAHRIADFQSSLDLMYKDRNNGRSPEYLYSYLARNSSYFSRSVLRNGNSEDFFIKTLSWLFAFSSSLDINIEECFIKKFPNICPYCLAKPCECIQNHKQPAIKMQAYKVREELQRKYETLKGIHHPSMFDIDMAVEIINGIYPSNQTIWSIYGSFYHFTRIYEELGEIHEAFTTFQKDESRKVNLEEELADFTAWLLSAWKMAVKEKSLQESLINYYSEGCPVCRKEVCECSDYSDRKEAIVNIADLESLKAEIICLRDLQNDNKKEIMELIISIDDALTTKSTTDTKRVLTQAKDTLDDISKISKSSLEIGENAVNAASILNRGYKLIESIFNNIS